MKQDSTKGWDWHGIIGTGQSLAVGALPVLSLCQPFGNLKLDLGGAEVPPWDPDNPELTMAPLVEPLRPLATKYPSPYPENLFGETLHTAMANQISALALDERGVDHVTVHSAVGECGQGIVALRKHSGSTTEITGRAYAAMQFEVAAIARLARARRKVYGVRAIVMTHGETDWESPSYRHELVQLLDDAERDLQSLTRRAEPLRMLLSQTFALPTTAGARPLAPQIQWRLGVELPQRFVCTGPKYQYPGAGDGIHLASTGYQALGEKTGQVYYERLVCGRAWQPLHPVGVLRDRNAIEIRFHVPVPPLAWDEALPEPIAWANGRGFEVRACDRPLAIRRVELDRDRVRIDCDGELPASGLTVGYAMTSAGIPMTGMSGSHRWGKLRDSDPFVGFTTGFAQPNYCVSFEMVVP